MPQMEESNYAFIDSQNLNLGINNLGWKLDYVKFRIYLKEKYFVKKAYIFIGFVALNQKLYDRLQESGFILKFKPIIPVASGKIKGNVAPRSVKCHCYYLYYLNKASTRPCQSY